MYFFGMIFLITVIVVAIFKNEKRKNNIEDDQEEEIVLSQAGEVKKHKRLSLFKSYAVIWRLFSLRSVLELTFILLTINVKFHLKFFYFYFKINNNLMGKPFKKDWSSNRKCN